MANFKEGAMEVTKIENMGDLAKLDEVKEAYLVELEPGESTTFERGERETLTVITFDGMVEIRVKGKDVTSYIANYCQAPRIWWNDGDTAEFCLNSEAKNPFRGLILRTQYLES